jgi:biotin carboxyl carrier protein
VKFEVSIHDKLRLVELRREQDRWAITLDGRRISGDAVEIAPNIFSLSLNGELHEIRVTPSPDGSLLLQSRAGEIRAQVLDPRAWRGRSHDSVQAEGRQEIVAPMPGKIVRVMVKVGESVEAGHGLLVVEAMKMQNEIRSPKKGAVERLLVKEGQPVNAGEVLCVIS